MRSTIKTNLKCGLPGVFSKWLFSDTLVISSIYLFGNMTFSSIFGFVFWVVASRLSSPSVVGFAVAVISTAQLLTFVGNLGLGMGSIRYLPEDDSPQGLFVSILLMTVIAGTTISAGYLKLASLLFPALISGFAGNLLKLAFILLVATSILAMIFDGYYLAFRKAKYSLYQTLIMNSLRIIGIWFLANSHPWGIIFATLIAQGVALYGTFFLFRLGNHPEAPSHISLNLPKLRKIMAFSFGNYLSNIASQLPRLVSVPMTLAMVGEQSSAYVFMAWMISTFVTAPGFALGNSALVETVYSVDDRRGILLRAVLLSLVVTLPIAAIVFGLASVILAFFGEDYGQYGTGLLRLLVASAPLVVINLMHLTYLRARDQIMEIVVSALIVASVSVGVFSLLLRQVGISSIGIGWLISQILASLFFIAAFQFKRMNAPPGAGLPNYD